VINTICDAALVYGYADQKTILDTKLIINVLEDKAEARRTPGEMETGMTQKSVPVVLGGGQADIKRLTESQKQSNDASDRRVTEFNRDAAKLLFKKYYHDK
jgi:hypothetical protein